MSNEERAEAVVSLWVNKHLDEGSKALHDDVFLLGSDIPDQCTDLVRRIVEAQAQAVAEHTAALREALRCYLCKSEDGQREDFAGRSRWVCRSCGAVWEVTQWNTVFLSDDAVLTATAALAAAPGDGGAG